MSLEALLSLNASGLVGQSLYRKLVARFGDAKAVLRAGTRDLGQVPGVGPATAKAIVEAKDRGAAEIDAAERAGARIISCTDADYPQILRTLYDQPLVLYVRGALEERDALAIGIVGSRKCTSYGGRQARRFGEDLARLGVTVVSGLARGIDTLAHRGALVPDGGRTVAILGSGLARMYPPENAKLAAQIAERGAVVSEFPMRAAPEPANFPRRNRIIAGFSLGVLVVEAAERSGALITADWATEMGREVFALPGPVESPSSRGCHLLIRQGAKLVDGAADVLEEIPALVPLLGERPTTLSPVERTVLGHLGNRALGADEVVARARLPEGVVGKALAALVEKGLATKDGGYLRSR
ncbi:MAG: DNA-processing protein DprA [Planctomycetota bacterium]|jgi:DNA processing protein